MDAKTPLRGLVYGGVASAIADAATVPFDVLKVRLQLQGEVGSAPEYRGMLDAAMKIGRREGLPAFFKGLEPVVVRQLTYGSLRFGLYMHGRQVLGVPRGSTESLPVRKMLAASAAGGASAFACNPLDLIKVRMMADGMRPSTEAPPRYSSLANAAVSIFRQEGPLGLYKGVVPTSMRASIVAAAEIGGYDEIKCAFLRRGWLREGVPLHFVVAMLSGFFATLASSPFDVVKSRLMSQPYDANGLGLRYSGTADCMAKSLRTEGWRFAFKGFWPAYLSKGPTIVLLFLLYEQLRIRGDRWLDGTENERSSGR